MCFWSIEYGWHTKLFILIKIICYKRNNRLDCFNNLTAEKNTIMPISDLKEQLGKYVEQETSRLLDKTAQHALDAVKDGEVDIDQLVDKWTNAFKQVTETSFTTYITYATVHCMLEKKFTNVLKSVHQMAPPFSYFPSG